MAAVTLSFNGLVSFAALPGTALSNAGAALLSAAAGLVLANGYYLFAPGFTN